MLVHSLEVREWNMVGTGIDCPPRRRNAVGAVSSETVVRRLLFQPRGPPGGGRAGMSQKSHIRQLMDDGSYWSFVEQSCGEVVTPYIEDLKAGFKEASAE
jgi:hypothetical protein